MVQKKVLLLGRVKVFVLDEADELLGSRNICEIRKLLPRSAQLVLSSATFSLTALREAELFAPGAISMLVSRDELMLESVKHFYIDIEKEEWKLDTLCDLYETLTLTQALIFCNTNQTIDFIADDMSGKDLIVTTLHDELDQRERDMVMRELRSGAARVLITSDILARGIDVQQVSLVVNYDFPPDHRTYVHRAGRCGRFGRRGVVVNLVATETLHSIRAIQNDLSIHMEEMPMNIADLL